MTNEQFWHRIKEDIMPIGDYNEMLPMRLKTQWKHFVLLFVIVKEWNSKDQYERKVYGEL